MPPIKFLILAYVPAVIYLASVAVVARKPSAVRVAIAVGGTAFGAVCFGLIAAYTNFVGTGAAVGASLMMSVMGWAGIFVATKLPRRDREAVGSSESWQQSMHRVKNMLSRGQWLAVAVFAVWSGINLALEQLPDGPAKTFLIITYFPGIILLGSMTFVTIRGPSPRRFAIAVGGTAFSAACFGLAAGYTTGSNVVAVGFGLIAFGGACAWIIGATKRKRHAGKEYL